LAQEVSKNIYIPHPTWPNHRSVFERAGCKVGTYPYYSREKRGFDFEQTSEFLQTLPEKSIILLHACCHNPTGCDPTHEQWQELSQLLKKKRLFPFFDFAYQGFGEGVDKDRAAIDIFLKGGHEMLIGYSCSKNFSMYCQRVGALFAVTNSAEKKVKVASQIKKIIRAIYSNPPAHGARLVTEVLTNETLRQIWEKDLAKMRSRLNKMRKELVKLLGNVSYLKKHKGMFSFIDLDKHQTERLIEEFGIYLTENGRISVAGLTMQNIDYVANSLLKIQ